MDAGIAHLFMNPNLGGTEQPYEAHADAMISGLNTRDMAFGRARLVAAQDRGTPVNRSRGFFDEVRVATTYDQVAPTMPEPGASLPLLAASLALLSGRRRKHD